MASFGDSFLDMAEAMLGKYNRTSSCEVLKASGKKKRSALKANRMNDNDKTTVSSSNPKDVPPTDNSDKKSERRSVVIQIPPKRQRITGNYSVVDIVQELNRAMLKVSSRSIVC